MRVREAGGDAVGGAGRVDLTGAAGGPALVRGSQRSPVLVEQENPSRGVPSSAYGRMFVTGPWGVMSFVPLGPVTLTTG